MKLKLIRNQATGQFLSEAAFVAFQNGHDAKNVWVNNIDSAAHMTPDEVPMLWEGAEEIDASTLES